MSVNQMGYEQAAVLLNSIVKQATGNTNIQTTSPADFVSVGTTALEAGYDKVLNAITQIIGRTLFSARPYNRKLSDLQMSDMEWGSIIRKLKIADVDWQDAAQFELVDGQSIDHWIVKKANVLQLNFYGQNTYELQSPSILMKQLDAAFRGPEELTRFFAMIATNIENQKEQKIESVARMLICNFIGGKLAANNGVIHLLTEYNAETGESLTATSVKSPDNFPNFIYWLYARLETLAGLMSERSQIFQINVTGKPINQHTERDNLKVKMFAPFMNAINARVRANTFDNTYLKMADTEAMNYCQSIQTPENIDVTPSYLNASGNIVTGERQQASDIIGVMYDVDAMGIVTQDERAMATPFNARGHYSNIFYSYVQKWFTDFTEKGIILKLD